MPSAKSIYALRNDAEKIRRLIAVLRGPNGCAWDRKQSLRTLAPLLIEEAYEVVEAIERKRPDMFVEEIGDLLFLVMTLFQCAKDEGWTAYRRVIDKTVRKYVTQHPHVFASRQRLSADEILAKWEARKARMKGRHPIDRVPKALPALYQAKRILDKAARLGLIKPVKVSRGGGTTLIGRKLLSLVRDAVRRGVDPESALRAEIRRLRSLLKRRPLEENLDGPSRRSR